MCVCVERSVFVSVWRLARVSCGWCSNAIRALECQTRQQRRPTLLHTFTYVDIRTHTHKKEGFLSFFFPGVVYLLWLVEHRYMQWIGDLAVREPRTQKKRTKRRRTKLPAESCQGIIMYIRLYRARWEGKEGARTSRREFSITFGLDDGTPLTFVGWHSNKTTWTIQHRQ